MTSDTERTMASERRVAPPAVGTVALACGHCRLPIRSALLGPGQRLWWRRDRDTFLVTFIAVRYWCRRCGKETVIGEDGCEQATEVVR
jgi:hypothetical protein